MAGRSIAFVCIAAAVMFHDGRVTASSFFGPTPYLSSADIPSGFFTGPYSLETFEDGSLDFGITFTAVGGFIITPGPTTDSVDADDGAIDGLGNGGRTFVADNTVTFTFPNPLPTAAGIVWTDGAVGSGTTFEAFGPGMVSLGTVGPALLADGSYAGGTAEDRFFGVQNAAGVLAVRITHNGGQVEVDHVMFGSAFAAPDPASCTYPFTKGSGASFVKYCVSERGTIVNFEAPLGKEHIGNGDVWEGFVVCSGTTAHAWDLTTDESGFGPATVLSGPSASGITLRRVSPQYQLDQQFALDTKEKDVTVTMTLTNISPATIADVRLSRAYDPDVDGDGNDVEATSLRGVWASGSNAVSLTGTAWTFTTDTAVDTITTAACSPASGPTPATTGDASLANLTYRLGNLAKGAKKKVTFVYRMQ